MISELSTRSPAGGTLVIPAAVTHIQHSVPHGCGAIELPRTTFLAPTRRRAHLLPKTTSFSSTASKQHPHNQQPGLPHRPPRGPMLARRRRRIQHSVPHGCGAIELPRTTFFAPTRRRAHLLPKTTSFSTTEGAPGEGSARPQEPSKKSSFPTGHLPTHPGWHRRCENGHRQRR